MTVTDVVFLRDLLLENSDSLVVYGDNMHIFSNKVDYLVWDDDNERLYCIRANVDQYSQAQRPVEIIVTTYENIQYMTGSYTNQSIKDAIESISAYIPAAEKDNVIKYFMNMHNQMLEEI